MDSGAWWATAHGIAKIAKSWTQLSSYTQITSINSLEQHFAWSLFITQIPQELPSVPYASGNSGRRSSRAVQPYQGTEAGRCQNQAHSVCWESHWTAYQSKGDLRTRSEVNLQFNKTTVRCGVRDRNLEKTRAKTQCNGRRMLNLSG